MSGIDVKDLTKRYGGRTILEDINLTVRAGEFVAIVGPSGCGKSTLLKIIAGLEKGSGAVLIGGRPVQGPDSSHLLVLQEHALYPWRTVEQNISLGPEIQGWPEPKRKERVNQLIEAVGLSGFNDYYPHQISGGMCQRVSLARAFIMEPEVLLLDEPFGALDALTRMDLQQQLLRLWQMRSATVVLVTHDVEEALLLADTVMVMEGHPGRFIGRFAIDLPRPQRRRASEIVNQKSEILDLLCRPKAAMLTAQIS